jgi:MoaA/NifB/PqqE/SkfB family radical SAM enzyme
MTTVKRTRAPEKSDPNFFHIRDAVNLDITHRCPLECLRCQRYFSFTAKGLKVPGGDMPLDRFQKVLNQFKHINFCGQVSDPVHHPQFIEMLKMCHDQGKSVSVHHASGGKKEDWYPKAWEAHPYALWYWGIDGLPKDSHKYRKNQDGEKMFRLMIESTKYLKRTPIWQYIIFSYNENDIDEARDMIKDVDNLKFMTMNSSRWISGNDWLKPKDPELSLNLNERQQDQFQKFKDKENV